MSEAAETEVRTPAGGIAVVAVLSVWALLAPYLGPSLGLVVVTRPVVEVVDHVLPAAVVLLSLPLVWRAGRFTNRALAVVGLAGVWMTATHAPLVAQAFGPGADMPAALFHALPGASLLLWAVTRFAWRMSAPDAT